MAIDLHIWPTGNGYKIVIMLEECGLDYKVHWVNIFEGDQFREEFQRISPNNKMPAIVDPDGPGGEPVSLFECGAILQYLGRKTGKFYPSDERACIETDQWLFWQVGGLGPMLGQAHHFVHYMKEKIPYAVERFGTEANRLYGVMDRRHAWQGVRFSDYPRVMDWFARIEARPAVQRALRVGADKAPPIDTKTN